MRENSTEPEILVRRSMVTGAATNPEHREKAWRTGADAVMLDLEDTVPANSKDAARAALRSAVPELAATGVDVLVRVNAPAMRAEDLDAAVWPGLDTIVVPKVETDDELLEIDRALDRLERERGLDHGSVRLSVLIESVRGLAAVDRILQSTRRVLSVTLGAEDFTYDIWAEPTPSGDEVLLPQLQLVLAARLAGATPLLGVLGSLALLHDLDTARRRAQWARSVGFAGAACSAHSHVSIANETFRPDPANVERARRVIEAYAESSRRGDGRIEFEGAIIDTPVVLRAERLVRWDEAVAAVEARKHTARSTR